jgi:diguanylate cyclase (GGDEF)-like protein
MNLTLFLPWFPILLGVGVGGRLLGRGRGLALGVLCAFFWIVLTQASAGITVWKHPWPVATIILGAIAIAAMGAWAGDHAVADPEATARPGAAEATPPSRISNLKSEISKGSRDHGASPGKGAFRRDSFESDPCDPGASGLDRLAAAIDRFDDWLVEHRGDADPWPAFGEFIRTTLYECCRATHVKPYRLTSEGDELIALREPDPFAATHRLSARVGIVGHVVTTGRSYHAGDRAHGELVGALAEASRESIAWCFAVSRGTKRLGAVMVGRLDVDPGQNRAMLGATQRLIGQFWCTLDDAVHARAADQYDPVSGLHTRPAFLEVARQTIGESYASGEPVAAVVIALEGLRSLNDSGRWETADELVRDVSAYLRGKVRMDDRLGRFDGSRFILLLRRVDSELATLIVRQIITRLTTLCGDSARWRAAIHVRCGLAGSGTEQPDPRTLISEALTELQRARSEGLTIARDLRTIDAAPEVSV